MGSVYEAADRVTVELGVGGENNLVGKDLRKADETKAAIEEVQQPKVADVRPLSDVIELVSLMCDTSTDGKGGQSHVIIRYKDVASVQPPNWYLLENQSGAAASAPAGAADGVGGRTGGRPGGGRPGGARPGASTQVPTSSAGQEFIQRVWVVGDGSPRNEATLWPPFQDVRLVRVAKDARSAYFVRGGSAQPVEGQDPATLPKPLEEEVFKTSLEISEDVMRAVVEIQRGAVIGARCKVSSHTFICGGVTVEDEHRAVAGGINRRGHSRFG
jgi:hypothetical protein